MLETRALTQPQKFHHPDTWCGAYAAGSQEATSLKNVYYYATKKDVSEKTPMCRIAELARFNKIKHEYILMDESGPAHQKRFTVKLMLPPDEEFEGCGASIKKAQQSAAENAIEHSRLPRPPNRSKKGKRDNNNPMALLNNVAEQLNLSATYEDIDGLPAVVPQPMPRPPLNQTAPHGPYAPLMGIAPFGAAPHVFQPHPALIFNYYRMPGVPTYPQAKPVVEQSFWSTLVLGDGSKHTGEGRTKFAARSDAATKALFHLKPLLAELEASLAKPTVTDAAPESPIAELSTVKTTENDHDPSADGSESPSNDAETPQTGQTDDRRKNKSVVSRIHECALRLKMNVEFEVMQESGVPHLRHYVLRCRLAAANKDPIETEGEGNSKKAAKQDACQKMLDRLSADGFDTDPLYLASIIVTTTKKSTVPQPKESKRKTIIKDMKMDPQYGHHINPVSRLIQVMQSLKEAEPVFRLIGEQGHNRSKEFTVEVTCQDITLIGVGPNKRLAKRAAAEAMLGRIGYIKPMPPPGKSLLKKRNTSPLMDIGVFDPNDLSAPAPTPAAPAPDAPTPAPDSGDSSRSNSSAAVEDPNGDEDSKPRRRKVTFSNQVSACPPPDDSSYPEASIAPLKAEVVAVSKPRRRGKDSKKYLLAEERQAIIDDCRKFLSYVDGKPEHTGYASLPPPTAVLDGAVPNPEAWYVKVVSAKERLDMFSKTYKFTVNYIDFPKEESGATLLYSTLVNLGLDKPIVCHGVGSSEEAAHNDAAYNAIDKLACMEPEIVVLPPSSPLPQLQPVSPE